MNKTEEQEKTQEGWPDDLLNRYDYSVFLTNYLELKCGPSQPSIVAALDAPWGLGKTFFVKHWADDLRTDGRSVLFFNAWENDSADDPTVAFMAELNGSLEPLYEQLPKSAEVKIEIEEKRKQVIQSFRRAVVPVLSVVSKALIKKATGVAVEELSGVLREDEQRDPALGEAAEDNTEKSSIEALDKSLDTIFEKTLETHSQRLKSISLFRLRLEELIEKLHEHGATTGPLWVFIDELDRCRPDYAIRLLEGIKHLFSVKGVLFVVSTNLEQLSKAVGALYGANFDGYQYLKRFFTLEYTLPEPTRFNFLVSATKGSVLESMGGCPGVDRQCGNEGYNPVVAMNYVAEAMLLDLRSIQQIIAIVEAAVLGLPKNFPVAAMWIFFLAAVKHLRPELFRKIVAMPAQNEAISEACDELFIGPKEIPSRDLRTAKIESVRLKRVITVFYNASLMSRSEISRAINKFSDSPPYPENLILELAQFGEFNGKPSIQSYPKLLSLAGHLST